MLIRNRWIHSGLAAVAAALAAAQSASAGFVLNSGANGGDAVALTSSTPAVGHTFVVSAGTFSLYTPATPQDPQLSNSDLGRYGFTLDAVVQSLAGTTANYAGTYEVFYNTDGNDTRDASDLRVAGGTTTFSVTPLVDAGVFKLNVAGGVFQQLEGAENPAFGDFSYGGNPVVFGGTVTVPAGTPTLGSVALTLTQAAAVPEPAALAALSLGAAALLRRKRV